jgi:hypothetical protein
MLKTLAANYRLRRSSYRVGSSQALPFAAIATELYNEMRTSMGLSSFRRPAF